MCTLNQSKDFKWTFQHKHGLNTKISTYQLLDLAGLLVRIADPPSNLVKNFFPFSFFFFFFYFIKFDEVGNL